MSHIPATFLVVVVVLVSARAHAAAFVAPSPSGKRKSLAALHQTTISTHRLTTASGRPVCRYALGGAARSVQPASLPVRYQDLLPDDAAPFYFYYNPHRYPAFLSGVARTFDDDENEDTSMSREDVFVASGGAERSPSALDQRLADALVHCGGEYLDAFVLEYVCPDEVVSDNKLGKELERAIEHVHGMKKQGRVRYVVASTHSHSVGAALAMANLPANKDGIGNAPAFDALMLRYSMSHKNAAESLSLPAALERDIPVWAFTTTRWNRLQTGPPPGSASTGSPLPTTSDCIKFALHHSAIDAVLHSARDEEELDEALRPLLLAASSGQSSWLSGADCEEWRKYGSNEMEWNEDDAFDEYPEESMN